MVKRRRGLLLEGGAARGAYQVGAYRQLWLSGRRYRVIVGVSVGAINGASFVQHPSGMQALRLWQTFNFSKIFGQDLGLSERTRFLGLLLLRRMIAGRGISLDPLRSYLARAVDERAIRRSPIDYGFTTLVAGELRSLRLFKDQVATGELLDYIIASASLPVFRVRPVQNRYLLDGGLGDALPISMLIERGCDEIDVIRTVAARPLWKHYPAKIDLIIPSTPLPPCYDFRPQVLQQSIKLGKMDALRVLRMQD